MRTRLLISAAATIAACAIIVPVAATAAHGTHDRCTSASSKSEMLGRAPGYDTVLTNDTSREIVVTAQQNDGSVVTHQLQPGNTAKSWVDWTFWGATSSTSYTIQFPGEQDRFRISMYALDNSHFNRVNAKVELLDHDGNHKDDVVAPMFQNSNWDCNDWWGHDFLIKRLDNPGDADMTAWTISVKR